MPATNPPTDPTEQLQWLVDREAIRDLVHDFAVRIDDKDQAGYAANFAEDGVLELPFGSFRGRQRIAAMSGPPPHVSTHHLIGEIVIDLAGDTATTRTYLLATHRFDPADKSDKAHAGGWYTHEVVRTPEGWRFTRVRLDEAWADARPMTPGRPDRPGGPQ